MNDRIKAEIEYLRQWLFVATISVIGVFSWVFSYKKIDVWLYSSLFGFIILFCAIIVIHKKIKILFKKWK